MAKEIIEILKPKDGDTFIDMTFGSGGHSKRLLSSGKKINIYAVDRDPLAYQKAITLARDKYLIRNGQRVIPILARFSELTQIFNDMKITDESIDGVIMDLGTSSMQFDDPKRGFALSSDGPLDMRMDGERFPEMPTAADVINTLGSYELAKIFKIYGEEKLSKKYAQMIVDARFMMKGLSSTKELANLIANVNTLNVSFDKLGRPTHSATKVFQALRIFVNNELNELNYALEKIRYYVKRSSMIDPFGKVPIQDNETIDGGKIVILSFHSLEDRIVKRHLIGTEIDDPIDQSYGQRHYSALETADNSEIYRVLQKKWRSLYKHVVLPSESEVLSNPRCRSAKLRAAVRVL